MRPGDGTADWIGESLSLIRRIVTAPNSDSPLTPHRKSVGVGQRARSSLRRISVRLQVRPETGRTRRRSGVMIARPGVAGRSCQRPSAGADNEKPSGPPGTTLCLRQGSPAPGWGNSVRRSRWVDGCASHPARRRPGRAEQTSARAASARTHVKVHSTWRPGRRPAPPVGGSTANGISRLIKSGSREIAALVPRRRLCSNLKAPV